MGTIANKLEYLNDTKEIFKNKLNSIGAEIDNSTKFRDYINILDDIYDKANAASEYEFEGDTKQITYSGIQLFDIDGTVESGTLEKYNNGLKLTGNLVNEMVKFDLPEELSPSTDYTIKLDIVKNTLQVDPTLRVTLYDSTLGSEVSVTEFTASGSQTISLWRDSCDKISFSISAPEEEGAEMIIDNIILVEGTPASITYEPYVGGKVSPNPDYPQNIEVVTGRQEIDVVGKNLFDNNKIASIKSTSLLEEEIINTGKKITYIGANTSTGYIWVSYVIMDLTNYVGKTIRFKCNFTPSGSSKPQYNIGLCNADGDNRTTKASTTTSGQTISFTVPELVGEQKYLYVLPYINNSTGTLVQNDYVEFTDMILTIDNEDMTYEEYKGQSYEINLGKNLLKNTNVNSGDNNYWNQYSTYNEETGTLTRSTTATTESTIQHRINLKNNTQYTISCLMKSNGNVLSSEIFVYNVGITKVYNKPIYDLSTEYQKVFFTFTTDNTHDFTNAVIRFDNNGSTQSGTEATLTITDVMLVEGTDTEFAPYKTPIELCKINDYKDRIFKGSGVNLFDKDILQQGGLDLGGSGIETANPARIRSDFIEVQPNTSYVISHIDTIIDLVGIGLYKSDKSYDSLHKINSGAWNNLPFTFTTQSDTKYVRIAFRNADSTNITPDLDYKIQLELGENNQYTPYEPYNSKGKWLLHKEIGKVVLDGSENWGQYGGNNNGFLIYGNSSSPFYNKVGNYGGYCNYFVVENSYTTWTGTGKCGFNSASVFWLIHTDTSINTTDKFKTWLSTHNTIVYYVLSTPTTTEITDSELISQLETVKDYLFNYYLDEQFLLDYSDPEVIIK